MVRSLTIHFQPALPLWELLLNLPDPADGDGLTPVARQGLDWGRIAMACLLALIPIGPAGSVAVALATEVVGQVNDRSTVGR
jgi:hypothetical protein